VPFTVSRHFWEDAVEAFTNEAALNATEEANFSASTAFVVVGANLLSYEIPTGYQPAGEGFEYAVGEGDTLYYQPALKGVTRAWGDVTDGWSMIPCVIRLTMDTFELVDIIDLEPAEPTITNYRDASLLAGRPWFGDGLANLPGFIPWGRIGDCAAGVNGTINQHGELHAILRVGNWLFPQISNSNQAYAYNLASETYWRLNGWEEMPAQLLQADPQTDVAFESYAHDRYWYNVVAPIGDGKILLLVENQRREASVVSDFINTLTPEATVGGETIRDTLRAKWVNSSGTTSLEYSGDSGDWYDLYAYNWDLPDIQAGDLYGEPWGTGPGKPPYSGSGLTRDQAATESEFVAAIEIDLDDLIAVPRYAGMYPVDATMGLQVWDFSTTTPEFVETIYAWNDTTEPQDPVVRGASEYTITSTTFGALPVVEAGGAFADDHYVIDVETDATTLRNNDSDFTTGAGVMLHSLESLPVTGGDRFFAQSQDINNAEGPDGPALYKTEVDTGGEKHSTPCLLTVVTAPIVANPELPENANWHPAKICTDGTVAIALPRESVAGLIRCLPLVVDAPDWTVDPLDHLTTDPEEASHGSCRSNGVLTAQFLYAVFERDGGQTLLKIRVADLLDEAEALVEAAGTVVATVDLATAIGSSTEAYHDPLIVVNRRMVGVGATTFFEITAV
jgi:hypothetical protein